MTFYSVNFPLGWTLTTLTIKEIGGGRSRSYLNTEAKNGCKNTVLHQLKALLFVMFEDQDSVLFACEMLDQSSLYGTRIRIKPRERTEKVNKLF